MELHEIILGIVGLALTAIIFYWRLAKKMEVVCVELSKVVKEGADAMLTTQQFLLVVAEAMADEKISKEELLKIISKMQLLGREFTEIKQQFFTAALSIKRILKE